MEDDEEFFESNKFDECFQCKNRFKEWVCDGCGFGEEFEEEDPEEVDKDFKGYL